jgi:hypothetical protein
LSTVVVIDGVLLTIIVASIITGISFIWNRYLSKLDLRYQTIMDIVAIILSGTIIFLVAMWL